MLFAFCDSYSPAAYVGLYLVVRLIFKRGLARSICYIEPHGCYVIFPHNYRRSYIPTLELRNYGRHHNQILSKQLHLMKINYSTVYNLE